MSDRLPYEEQLTQQWNDLPLPDENMAWADMKRRLEEDDDKRIIPFWLRGCGLWSLLAVILLGFGWWFFRQYTSNSKKEQVQKEQGSPQQTGNRATKNDSSRIVNNQPVEKTNQVNPGSGKKDQQDSLQTNQPGTPADKSGKRRTITDDGTSIAVTNGLVKRTKKGDRSVKPPIPDTKSRTVIGKKGKQIIDKDDAYISVAPGSAKTYPDTLKTTPTNKAVIVVADSSIHLSADIKKTDSTLNTKKDSLKEKNQEEIAKNNIPKKDSAKQKSISFSAGIAENQLLPIDGQKLTPYNAQGRKGSLSDYLPSVYFRMYKDGKWFLQSEFRYGAPQYNREILYSQKSDSLGTSRLITSTKLKKTFYHQLPVSFNYFVLPNWSLGAGFIWNKFNSAVSSQDVIKHTVATGSDTVISLGTIVRNTAADSNFAKSYFQAIIETQYKWKRFSLGARYSFGLQPYLTFTLPGGTKQQEKNKSLQVFLRYELWRSKKIIKK